MTDALAEDSAVWVEVVPNGAIADVPATGASTRASTSIGARRGSRLDAEGNPNTCRCWRCKGGGNISITERAEYDRILARHLARMGEAERDGWLWQWSQMPNHGPDDIRALTAWIDIAQGKRVPEPRYLPRRAG